MAVPGIGDRLEGIHAVRAALAAGRVHTLVVEEGRAASPDIAELLTTAETQGLLIETVVDVRPMAATTAPQGVIAHAHPLSTLSLDELVSKDPVPAVVVLDHAEDPRNVGAIARSALAAGMSGVVVAGRRAAPLGATAFKAAVGAFEKLPVAVVSSIADAVKRMRDLGLWTIALAGESTESFYSLRILDEPLAIVVGAEGKGVGRLAAERCDVVARLPMMGDVESLNASVAAALAAFEVARARGTLS